MEYQPTSLRSPCLPQISRAPKEHKRSWVPCPAPLSTSKNYPRRGWGDCTLLASTQVASLTSNVRISTSWWQKSRRTSTTCQKQMTLEKTCKFTLEQTHFFAVRSSRFWVSGYYKKNDEFKAALIARIYESQYLASVLSDTFVKCINVATISCAQGKRSLHSRSNFISTFTQLHVHGDERWPMEITSNM